MCERVRVCPEVTRRAPERVPRGQSSEVTGLGPLVQRPQLLEARPPVPERLLAPGLGRPVTGV